MNRKFKRAVLIRNRIFFNISNVFRDVLRSVTFDQFNASLQYKSIYIYIFQGVKICIFCIYGLGSSFTVHRWDFFQLFYGAPDHLVK